jgi:hypothetical protein
MKDDAYSRVDRQDSHQVQLDIAGASEIVRKFAGASNEALMGGRRLEPSRAAAKKAKRKRRKPDRSAFDTIKRKIAAIDRAEFFRRKLNCDEVVRATNRRRSQEGEKPLAGCATETYRYLVDDLRPGRGSVVASYAMIADAVGYKERAVRASVAHLKDEGFIIVVAGDGRGKATEFVLPHMTSTHLLDAKIAQKRCQANGTFSDQRFHPDVTFDDEGDPERCHSHDTFDTERSHPEGRLIVMTIWAILDYPQGELHDRVQSQASPDRTIRPRRGGAWARDVNGIGCPAPGNCPGPQVSGPLSEHGHHRGCLS